MSSINTGAVIKAAGISLVLYLMFVACGYGGQMAMGFTPGTIPDVNSPTYSSLTLFSTLISCVTYLMYLAYGALYGFFARRAGTPVEIGSYALGGALTGIVVAFIGSILGAIITVATGSLSAITSQLGDVSSEMQGAMMVGGLIGLVVGFCIAFVLGGGLAAAGGAIYGAIMRNRNAEPASPAF
jgi:hypothetical protein